MAINPRFEPVPISLGRIGTTILVTSAREAAECMLREDWPGRGNADQKARRTLLAALEGKASAEEARTAFETAAKAAGIFMENAVLRVRPERKR